jgi:pimeloyl-ACP methyl ester carboxylesterase
MERKSLQLKTFKKISYFKTGQGPAVMLIHGYPAHPGIWRHIYPALSEHYTVLMPELMHEEGAWLQDDTTTMELLAAGFNDILEAEQIEHVVMAGHSMGGYMALAFADAYPEKLKGLSLVHSKPAADTEEKNAARLKTINIIDQGGKIPFTRQMVPSLFHDSFRGREPEVIAAETALAQEVSATALSAFYSAIMHRPDRTDVLYNAACPAQYIIGKSDNMFEIHKDLSVKTLANVNFVSLYADCAHMSMLEKPALLLQDLKSFISYCFR